MSPRSVALTNRVIVIVPIHTPPMNVKLTT